jgi:hypothetical protein
MSDSYIISVKSSNENELKFIQNSNGKFLVCKENSKFFIYAHNKGNYDCNVYIHAGNIGSGSWNLPSRCTLTINLVMKKTEENTCESQGSRDCTMMNYNIPDVNKANVANIYAVFQDFRGETKISVPILVSDKMN